MDLLKKCKECEIDKPLGEFHKKSSNRDGLRHDCIKCNLGIGYFRDSIEILHNAVNYLEERE